MHLTECEFKQGGEVRPLYTYQIPSPLAPFRSLILRVEGWRDDTDFIWEWGYSFIIENKW